MMGKTEDITKYMGDVEVHSFDVRMDLSVNRTIEELPDDIGVDHERVAGIIADVVAADKLSMGYTTPMGAVRCTIQVADEYEVSGYNNVIPEQDTINRVELCRQLLKDQTVSVQRLLELTEEFFDEPMEMLSPELVASQLIRDTLD